MIGNNNLYMENVSSVSLKMHDVFCAELKKFKPYSEMSEKELEDVAEPMFDIIWNKLEDYSNGYYARET